MASSVIIAGGVIAYCIVTGWVAPYVMHGNAFRITGPFLGESTGDRWILIPFTKASNAPFNVLFINELRRLKSFVTS